MKNLKISIFDCLALILFPLPQIPLQNPTIISYTPNPTTINGWFHFNSNVTWSDGSSQNVILNVGDLFNIGICNVTASGMLILPTYYAKAIYKGETSKCFNSYSIIPASDNFLYYKAYIMERYALYNVSGSMITIYKNSILYTGSFNLKTYISTAYNYTSGWLKKEHISDSFTNGTILSETEIDHYIQSPLTYLSSTFYDYKLPLFKFSSSLTVLSLSSIILIDFKKENLVIKRNEFNMKIIREKVS